MGLYALYAATNFPSNPWENVLEIIRQDQKGNFWIPIYGQNNTPAGMHFHVTHKQDEEEINEQEIKNHLESFKVDGKDTARILIHTKGKIQQNLQGNNYSVAHFVSFLNKNGQVETLPLQNNLTRKKLIDYMEKSAFTYESKKRKRTESEMLTEFWKHRAYLTPLALWAKSIIDYISEFDVKRLKECDQKLIENITLFFKHIVENNFGNLSSKNRKDYEDLKKQLIDAFNNLPKAKHEYVEPNKEQIRQENETFLSTLYQILNKQDFEHRAVASESFEIPKTPQKTGEEPAEKQGRSLIQVLFGRGPRR